MGLSTIRLVALAICIMRILRAREGQKLSENRSNIVKKRVELRNFKACEAHKSGAYLTYVSILRASVTQKLPVLHVFYRAAILLYADHATA